MCSPTMTRSLTNEPRHRARIRTAGPDYTVRRDPRAGALRREGGERQQERGRRRRGRQRESCCGGGARWPGT